MLGLMDISSFIRQNMEAILVEWEAFATTFGAAADKMSSMELRDHARQILEFVATDIATAESPAEARKKSKGLGSRQASVESASSIHGRLRYASGFTLLQLIAEYRALRASVLELWLRGTAGDCDGGVADILRFNEAIDQSLAEATVAYAAKVNETRDVFLGILGHDLRSPLAATATAGAYLARPGGFDDHIRQIGVRIKRGAATMNAMVNDLLGLARTQLGEGIPIVRRECDLLEVSQWAIEDAHSAHPKAQFKLNATGDLQGQFDGPRLQQLITNLANNAAQYGSKGKPIDVDIVGENTELVVRVSNEGTPIPAEAIPTMFDSLVQLPEREQGSRPSSSLGLGLFIAKQIAVAHGGTIGVTSNLEHGTTFSVTIPRT
jgi:signal transduction histidine kinase